jgi:phosphatidylserine/phosphatidylglycerophosphate/cardiolipin synthase-like enzyme
MPQLQKPYEFLDDFKRTAEHATQGVYVQSMNFEPGRVTNIISNILTIAANKGLETYLTFDWVHQKYIYSDLPLLPFLTPTQKELKRTLDAARNDYFTKLKNAGVKIIVTNANLGGLLFPAFKRNHIKMYIVDSDVAWIGGLNLFDAAFENADFMIKFTDKNIIQAIKKQYFMSNNKRAKNNYAISCNGETTFLVDVGKINNSIILKTAIDIAKTATKSIYFISQFLPDGKLLDVLINKAQKGIEVKIITSKKEDIKFQTLPYKPFYHYFLHKIEKYKNIHLIHTPTTVHAKLIIADESQALFGSHNLVMSGVLLGTEEIAVRTHQHSLVEELTLFFKEQLTI